MALKCLSVVLVLVPLTVGLPALTLMDLDLADDMQAVGSYVREVRAAAGPDDYHRTYENEGEGDIGYSRKKSGGGKKGYQQFDSYHKKGGDNYEFEKQDAYGLEDGEEKGAHGHHHEKAQKYTKPKKEAEDVVEEFNSEEQRENDHDKLLANASDGNGGTESHGHERADYTLPQKYSYGNGDEYNF